MKLSHCKWTGGGEERWGGSVGAGNAKARELVTHAFHLCNRKNRTLSAIRDIPCAKLMKSGLLGNNLF